jgi:S1-C subfamily serine protease
LVGGVTQGKFPNGTVVNAGGGAALTGQGTPIGSLAVSPNPGAAINIGSGSNPGNVAAGGGGSGFGGGTNNGQPNTDGATTLGGGGNYGGGGVVVPGGSGNSGQGGSSVGGGGGNSVGQGSGGINVPGGSGPSGNGTGGGTGGNPGSTGGNTLIGGQGGSSNNNGAGGIVMPGPGGSSNGGTTPGDNGGNTLVGGQGGNDGGTGAGGIVLPGPTPAGGNNDGGGNTLIGGQGGNDDGNGAGGIVIPGTGVANTPPTVIGGGGGTPSGGGTGGIVIPGGGTTTPPGGGTTTPPGNGGTGGSFGSSGGAFTNAGYGYGYPAFYSPGLGLYGEKGSAFLGVMFENDELIVAHVCEHGPAKAAGVARFDRIVAIDQQTFNDHAAFVAYMQSLAPLELVQLTVIRKDEPVNLVAELGGLLPPGAVYGLDIDGIFTESIAAMSDDDLHAQESLGFVTLDGKTILHSCPTDAAFLAGVRPGDELRSINEQTFADRAALTKFVASLKEGDVLTVVLRRDGRDETLSWAFGSPNADAATIHRIAAARPIVVLDKTLRVARVDRDSAAYAAGLRSGDVVTYFNGRPLKSLDEAADALAQTSPQSQVHFVADRGGRSQSVLWKLNASSEKR